VIFKHDGFPSRFSGSLARDFYGSHVRPAAHIYRVAVATLSDVARDMARDKNVIVTTEECVGLARGLLRVFGATRIYRITKFDPKATAIAAVSINQLLDVLAASQVLHLLRILEGVKEPDRAQTIAEAEVWMRDVIANDRCDDRFCWPDPLEMALRHHRARFSGPVSILLPNLGRGRMGYLLERTPASTEVGKNANVPVLVRCPAAAVKSSERETVS
jgi:hypothetical protein